MVGVGMEGVEVERLKVGRKWGEGGMIGERGGQGKMEMVGMEAWGLNK